MRALGLALAIVATVAAGAWERQLASRADAAPLTFRVATFNIHKGASNEDRYDLERTIDVIQALDADLVGVQEAMRNHPAFGCDDQPARIVEGLRRRTGRPWTHVHARAWLLDSRECMERGRGSGVATEDLAFFSVRPILQSSVVRLSGGRVGLAVRVAPLPRVPFIVTHLSNGRRNQQDRAHELGVLLPWAARQGPGVLVGDLNARPDADELGPVLSRYRDAWADAAAIERAVGVVSGGTRPFGSSRIDYVFYDPQSGLTVEQVDVVDVSAGSVFGDVSDHNPVVATFRRDPAASRRAGTP